MCYPTWWRCLRFFTPVITSDNQRLSLLGTQRSGVCQPTTSFDSHVRLVTRFLDPFKSEGMCVTRAEHGPEALTRCASLKTVCFVPLCQCPNVLLARQVHPHSVACLSGSPHVITSDNSGSDTQTPSPIVWVSHTAHAVPHTLTPPTCGPLNHGLPHTGVPSVGLRSFRAPGPLAGVRCGGHPHPLQARILSPVITLSETRFPQASYHRRLSPVITNLVLLGTTWSYSDSKSD